MSDHRMLAGTGALLLLAGALTACGDRTARDNVNDVAPPPGAETGALPSDTSAAAPAGATADLTDANIVALLDHANAADSTAGALAAEKATNPEVKQFAKLMMSEHHALRLQGQQLADRLKVTPEPPANDPVDALASKEMQVLQSTPKGAEFDRTYIDQEVAAHQAVIDLANQAHDQADNEQLKSLIEKALPTLEKHLDQAQKLQNDLSSTT